MPRFLAFALLCLLAAPTRARADFAADVGTDGKPTPATQLFFLDGAALQRGDCRDGGFYDRARCAGAIVSLPAARVIGHFGDSVGRGADEHETRMRELYVAIARIDQRLLELLNTEPSADAQAAAELERQIKALEHQAGDQEATVAGLRLQIKTIQDQLAQRDDVELRTQLIVDQTALDAAVAKRDATSREIGRRRADYIDARRATIGGAIVEGLWQQRSEKRAAADGERDALATLADERVAAAQLAQMLADGAMTYELLHDGSAFAAERALIPRFAQALVATADDLAREAAAAEAAAVAAARNAFPAAIRGALNRPLACTYVPHAPSGALYKDCGSVAFSAETIADDGTGAATLAVSMRDNMAHYVSDSRLSGGVRVDARCNVTGSSRNVADYRWSCNAGAGGDGWSWSLNAAFAPDGSFTARYNDGYEAYQHRETFACDITCR